jgi:hypothetical protein
MQLQARRTDICQTCIHVSECVHYQQRRHQGESILHCENFDDRPVFHVMEGKTLETARPSGKPSTAGTAYIRGRMKGLCVNCERRGSCGFPIRDAGVWHCEEYC